MELTARELHVLKTMVLVKAEQAQAYQDVDLATLYGKLNMLWGDARKEERQR